MSIKRLIAYCIFFTTFGHVNAQTMDVVTIEFPPFTTQDAPDNGLCFNLLQKYAVKNSINTHFNAVFVPPARAEKMMMSGDYCLSFYPPASLDDFEFIPLSEQSVKLGFIRRRQPGSFAWENLSDLRGKSAAVLRANQGGPVLQKIVKAGINVVYVNSITQGLRMLDSQRVDYAFGDNTTIAVLSNEIGIREESLQFSESILLETVIGVYRRKTCEFPHQSSSE